MSDVLVAVADGGTTFNTDQLPSARVVPGDVDPFVGVELIAVVLDPGFVLAQRAGVEDVQDLVALGDVGAIPFCWMPNLGEAGVQASDCLDAE